MANQSYPVEVQSDFLEKMTRAKPVHALSELIWNALDADASVVSVSLGYNDLDSLSTITVVDNGNGIPRDDAPAYFRRLGGSWKKPGASTPSGRFLHGQEGQGRFKAFTLGRVAEWAVTYDKAGALWSYTIRMTLNDVRNVKISDEKPAKKGAKKGVVLTIEEPLKEFRFLTSGSGLQDLTEIFALYLADYDTASIILDGEPIDPGTVISSTESFPLPDIVVDRRLHYAQLHIVEWTTAANRGLYLCTNKRFPLVQVERRFHVGDFQFSAYLSSSYFDVAQRETTLDLSEMQPSVAESIDAAQKLIRDYFRSRAAQKARTVVEDWKDQRVYPFAGEPVTPIEQVERQVFDMVAVQMTRHLPDFENAQIKNKAFQLRILRQAIEKSPEELQIIMGEVLNLPKREQVQLANLLRETSLSAIISSAKVVADRLTFLTGLESILFDPEPRKRLKERSQLHRIIAQNCWIFGEEFGLSVDDQSLTEVLRAHAKLLDPDIVINAPVKHISQTRGIVDLMLSKAIKQHRPNQLAHLVVELKAPSVNIGSSEITQIENYAFSVVDDPRFRNVGTEWSFWVISDDLGSYGRNRIADASGIVHQKGNLSIYAKSWGQVLEENRTRLKFFQDKLEVEVDKASSIKYIQEHYADYLEGVFEEQGEVEAEEAAAADEGKDQ